MKRKKVLILDDEKQVQAVYSRILSRKFDLDIDLAGTAEDALELASKNDYDLIITDLMLPGVDGMEFAGKVKEMKPRSGILMITAYDTPENREAAFEKGVAAFLGKPVDINTLRNTAASILKN